MSVCRFPKYAGLYAGTESFGCMTPYIRTRIVVFVPSAVGAAEAGKPYIGIDLFRCISHCEIKSSMVSNLTIVCADIVPYLLIWIATGNRAKSFARIVFIPEIRPKKVCYAFILPCGIILIMQTSAQGPLRGEPVFRRRYGPRLSMPCHEITEDVHRRYTFRRVRREIRTVICQIGLRHSRPIDQALGCMRKNRLPLGLCPPSSAVSDGQIYGILHREPVRVPDMLKREIWLEIIVLTYIVCLSVSDTPVLVIVATIYPNLIPAEPLRALVMPLRRSKGSEKKSVALAKPLADIEHI